MALNEMNENWEKDAPTLASIEKINIFSVPDGYFDTMQQHLHSRINISQFDIDENCFKVPDQYFDSLSERILSISKIESLKGESSASVFQVPHNYFESLEHRVRTRLSFEAPLENRPKVKNPNITWMSYAAAACITAIISLGIYFYPKDSNNIESRIADVPSTEIINYLQLYSDAGDAPVILETLNGKLKISDLDTKLSDDAIEEYLELNL